MSPTRSVLALLDATPGPLTLSDVWSHGAYLEARPELVKQVIEHKRLRRLRVGPHCSLVFETRASVWFQVHEELCFVPREREAHAAQLLAQYAPLLPPPGELRSTLFLECSSPELARELSLTLARNIHLLELRLPHGRFVARALESLDGGIPGLAYLGFAPSGEGQPRESPSLRWTVPGYGVISSLAPEQAQELTRLAHGKALLGQVALLRAPFLA